MGKRDCSKARTDLGPVASAANDDASRAHLASCLSVLLSSSVRLVSPAQHTLVCGIVLHTHSLLSYFPKITWLTAFRSRFEVRDPQSVKDWHRCLSEMSVNKTGVANLKTASDSPDALCFEYADDQV